MHILSQPSISQCFIVKIQQATGPNRDYNHGFCNFVQFFKNVHLPITVCRMLPLISTYHVDGVSVRSRSKIAVLCSLHGHWRRS